MEDKIDLHEIALFLYTLNATETLARKQGKTELESILKKAQEIIFELLGKLEER